MILSHFLQARPAADPFQKEQSRHRRHRAEPQRRPQVPLGQGAEGQVGHDGHRVHHHGVDAQRRGPVAGADHGVLQPQPVGLEQTVGYPQQPDAPHRQRRPVGGHQHQAAQGRGQAEQPRRPPGARRAGEPGREGAAQPQQAGDDVHRADGRAGHAAALVLQLVEKDRHRLVDLGEQAGSHQQRRQPRRRQGGPQRGLEGFPGRPFRRGGAHFGQPQGEQRRRAVAEHRQQGGQPVIVPHKEGEHRRGPQQPGFAQAVVDAEHMLALLRAGAKVQDAGIHAGQAGDDHAEQHPLSQEPGKVRGLPENDLGKKIQPAADAHRALVADAVRHHAPGHFQHDAQGIADALDEQDLEDADPLHLPVEGGNGAVKDHALQQRDAVQQGDIAFMHTDASVSGKIAACPQAGQTGAAQRRLLKRSCDLTPGDGGSWERLPYL